jgi:DNA mismatch repair protein MutS2
VTIRTCWPAPDSLILLDELGSGTDPEEGAALAVALLEGLLAKGALAVLTTHLTQLAATALERQGATCAAMEFDGASGRPTYHLRPGAPGSSEALALAKSLGLDDAWIGRAEALLGKEHRDLRRLLQEVEAVRRQLAEEQAQVERQERKLVQDRGQLAAELEALVKERAGVAGTAKRELDSFRKKVSRQLHSELETMRRELEQGRRKGVASESLERLFREVPESARSEPEARGMVKVGEKVRHLELNWEGRLQALRAEVAEVTVRGKRVRCGRLDLVPAEPNGQGDKRPKAAVRLQRKGGEDSVSPSELNLVGKRVEPALEALDRFLDQALLAAHKQVRVVHGFGSGRLRAAVREHLRPHPAVDEIRAGRRNEGGDGATVVTLKED